VDPTRIDRMRLFNEMLIMEMAPYKSIPKTVRMLCAMYDDLPMDLRSAAQREFVIGQTLFLFDTFEGCEKEATPLLIDIRRDKQLLVLTTQGEAQVDGTQEGVASIFNQLTPAGAREWLRKYRR
jgi:hypothetical protein